MYVLGYYKFKCFVYPTSLSCVSHCTDICTVAIKNIRNMHAVSTNQIADILHFNDKGKYRSKIRRIYKRICSTNRSSQQRCSIKKIFLKILQYLQENTCVGVSF